MHLRQAPQIGPSTITLSYRTAMAGEPMLAHTIAPAEVTVEPEEEYDPMQELLEALADRLESRLDTIEEMVRRIEARVCRPTWGEKVWRSILWAKSRLMRALRLR